MRNRSKYLKAFMQEYEFPEEAIGLLLQAYDKIWENEKAKELFENSVMLYEIRMMGSFEASREKMQKVAELSGVHVYTTELLMVLAMSEFMKELYIERGIESWIYHDTCKDFKAKMMYCKERYDIWGTEVGAWFDKCFNLTRFILGRLQFEMAFACYTVAATYKTVALNQVVVNVHIPATGALLEEDCRESFLKAYEFFKPYFPNSVVPFVCFSWLLTPRHETMLSPDSNIRRFMNFFKIKESLLSVEGALKRNIFKVEDLSDIDSLPNISSLQRAYIEVLKKGEMPLSGVGAFHIKDGKFI